VMGQAMIELIYATAILLYVNAGFVRLSGRDVITFLFDQAERNA